MGRRYRKYRDNAENDRVVLRNIEERRKLGMDDTNSAKLQYIDINSKILAGVADGR